MSEYLSNKIRIISFVSIIMVVYLHSYNLAVRFADSTNVAKSMDLNGFIQLLFSHGVTSIALPAFSAISGFLFFLNFKPTFNNFITKYKKRVKSLLIPYLFWSLWGIVLFYILQSIPHVAKFFTSELVSQYSIGEVINKIFLQPLPYQLWFLRDLMIVVAITPILFYAISKFSFYALIPLILIWLFDINPIIISNRVILFFSFGALMSIKKIDLSNIVRGLDKGFALLLWVWVGVLGVYVYFASIESSLALYMHRVMLILGLFLFWIGYDKVIGRVKNMKRLLFLTKFTFFIFCAHEPIMTIIKKLLLRWLSVSEAANLTAYIFAPIITITLVVSVGIFLRTYLNPFFKVIIGGRGQ